MFSFFRRRDAKVYPADKIGDALYERFPKADAIPDKAELWFDVYFKTEADADAMQRYVESRHPLDLSRDHDTSMENEPTADGKDTYGAWNVEFTLLVKPRHADLAHIIREVERAIRDYRGNHGGWHLGIAEKGEG